MLKQILTLVILLFSMSGFSQDFKYFDTKRDYIYDALYIDSIGDTITNEKLTIRIPDKRWIGQPWKQKSIIYIYDTDTIGFKNYIDPSEFFHEKNMTHLEKHGKSRLKNQETTGGIKSKRYSYVYMHPPRTNQYRMLFYAPHPYFFYSAVKKVVDTALLTNQNAYGAGYFHQEYIYHNIGKKEILNDSIQVYQVNVSSNLISNKGFSETELNFYSSTLEALFSFEYGFTKMHYAFKSGVKIEFDLVEVIENE